MTKPRPQQGLTEAQDRFIAAWGQMGSTWGISRTMAEVHAMLYIMGRPLCTDDVMERLEISRGNASMSLRALLDWGIVRRSHKRGDRKEYFEAEQVVWALLKAVVRERMKREIEPALASLFEIRDMTAATARAGQREGGEDDVDPGSAAAHQRRLEALIGLLTLFEQLGERFVELPTEQLRDMAQVVVASTAEPEPPTP